MQKKNNWLDGIMGLVVADALGVPVEFTHREELKKNPVTGMRGYGTYNLPAGSWSDDTSMTLATLSSLKTGYDLKDMMDRFAEWMTTGTYTPFEEVFDIGRTCHDAIAHYMRHKDVSTCGRTGERENGNGSLMRILPVCLYLYEKQKAERLTEEEVISRIHEVSALTHAHIRSKIACGLYFFLVRAILDNNCSLQESLQRGLDAGFAYYADTRETAGELMYYARFHRLENFKNLPEEEIESSGYVVASLEAALWCLVNTESYKEATLMAVNLGSDTDTVAAIAGGLAGLYYGYEGIPEEWLKEVRKREWVEGMIGNERGIK